MSAVEQLMVNRLLFKYAKANLAKLANVAAFECRLTCLQLAHLLSWH